jgi:hypothetical protein
MTESENKEDQALDVIATVRDITCAEFVLHALAWRQERILYVNNKM